MKWEILNSEYLIKNKWLTVRKDNVRMSNGVEVPDFYVLEYPSLVNVLAITEDGLFLLERQYRHGLQEVGYELCAGTVESGENPLDCAKRELLEETGYGDGEWSLYYKSAPNPASMDNINYTFLARDVRKISSQHLERTEDISVHLFTEKEVIELLDSSQIIQGMMQAPLWKFFYDLHK